jgi:DNA-binding beta-propeller fold protein YncE
VNWLGQFPEDEADRKKSFGNLVSEVVFGKKPKELVKPFSVLAMDQEHYLIIDQGSGEIVTNEEGKIAEAKGMKKRSISFPSLVDLTGLPNGEILFTDSRLNQVFQLADDKLSFFSEGYSFIQPTGIAFSEKTDEIWVVETGAHKITVLDREGSILRTIGRRGSCEGCFNFPTFIWIDASGRVYIVDSMNFRIQVLNSQGDFLYDFGEQGDATGFMARPKGVATDSRGNIYVVDALFHVVQIFDSGGNFLYSFGKQGQDTGEFWMPAGIHIDKEDRIYVADSYNARIQVFQLVKN